MAFVIFWLLCGLVCAVVASNKGRNGCAWFLGGMLLGPIGIVLILVTSPNEQGLVQSGTLKKCPFCAEMIKSEAKVCRYCSRELEPLQIAGQTAEVLSPPKQLPEIQNIQEANALQVRDEVVPTLPSTPIPTNDPLPTNRPMSTSSLRPSNNIFSRKFAANRPRRLG